jgi:hypothetical protein
MSFERHLRTARLARRSARAEAAPRGTFVSARFSVANRPHAGAEPSIRSAARVLRGSSRGGRIEGSLWRPFAPITDTSSCNTQLQLATFPRSADYTGLKSNLSPFRINTSKNLCTFRISLISGHLKRDYILDTKAVTCYAFFMRGFLDSAATFLMCLTTLGWNKCFISSSLLMSRGCFFFFMVTR